MDIPAGLREFRGRYPQVRISLRVGASKDLVEQVRQGSLDVAFLGLPTTFRPEGVTARELARGRLVAAVAPDHPLAARERVPLAELAAEPFVDLPPGTAGRAQTDLAFAAAGLVRDVAFEVDEASYIPRLVGPGLAVAMLPAAYVPQLTGIAVVEVTDAPTRIETVVWPRTGPSPATAAFLALLGIPAAASD